MKQQSTILIVDDEPFGRENLADLLATQGYELVFANNGPECLRKVVEFTPDVILLDVMMPEMDGFEVCRRIRAEAASAEVPIIMVTALDDRQSRLQGIEVGADDFISKPLDRVELRARLRTITRLNRYRRLISQRARFQWVVDQADQAYLILTETDEIRYANAQARRYLGLPQDDHQPLVGKFQELALKYYQCRPKESWRTWPGLLPPDYERRRFLVRPESATTEMQWLQVDLLEMTPEQDEVYLVRLEDITAAVVEERFRWSFQAQISHKLKTPLMQLIGGVELLMDGQSTLSETDRSSFLKMIYRGCLQLQDAMRGVFQYVEASDIARAGHGQSSLAEISTLINDIDEALKLDPIQIICEGFTDPAKVHVSISIRAIELILRELLSNAKKFHPRQSPSLEVHFSPGAEGIRIRICDDGLTLSAEQLMKMWYPYHQAEKYFTGQVPGMGLGLSVVAALIWGIGGSCQAYNRPDGPGVVVELVLPQIEEAGYHV